MKLKVGVVFGGETVEHEVSIITALQAIENMNSDKYDIVPIYIAKDRTWYTGHMLFDIDVYKDFKDLKKYATPCTLVNKNGIFYLQRTTGIFRKDITELDIAFPLVHGNNVEDGTIHGYLKTIGIPFVGSGVLGSALGQDKVIMKQVFSAMNLPIVDYVWFYDTEYAEIRDDIVKQIDKMEYPVIVKPATLGSSVGITFVKSSIDLNKAIEDAMKYDEKVVVEKAVPNLVEVNCSVLGNYSFQETSVIEEVLPADELLSYQDKYIGGGKGKASKGMAGASRIIPARIDQTTEKRVRDLAVEAFRALNLSGVCRVDFLINKDTKEVYINEPNTIPGSLSFYLWEPAGKKYTELLDDVITLAVKDYKNKSKKIYSFDTNILSGFVMGAKGLKGIKGSKGKLK
jgi:D-alanine--D-alanine ligase